MTLPTPTDYESEAKLFNAATNTNFGTARVRVLNWALETDRTLGGIARCRPLHLHKSQYSDLYAPITRVLC
jgi:hypothetical protein